MTGFFAITPNPVLSAVIWFIAISVLLYIARVPAHAAILALCQVFDRGLKAGAEAVSGAEEKLVLRNREVLLAAGREAAERMVEREFDRVDASVRRELADYPRLHRRLSEEITAIDDDYKQSTEVPPPPPDWVDAVAAVAKMSAKSEGTVGKILDQIHRSVVSAEAEAVAAYRHASSERNKRLKAAMPHWRHSLQVLGSIDKKVSTLHERCVTIDRHMDDYENIVKGTDRAARMLSASAFSQFFVSVFVLLIAVGGAVINFNLIARPMAEMVGGTNMIGGYQVADIAALVIILVEISMGLFLMESLRITRLFPVIGALNDRTRVRMIWITLTILTILAAVEAGLAFMREILLQDELATSAVLRGQGLVEFEPRFLWITTAAQMGMGFILPFALTFVAIPLETFIHATRTVFGAATAAVLRGVAVCLRVLGDIFASIGKLGVNVYDLLIFAPLWTEDKVKARWSTEASKATKVTKKNDKQALS